MTVTATEQRQQLDRILASPLFQSSRQARLFLSFTAGEVFAGRTEIDQFAIAAAVLDKPDFDPTIDASVRKLAAQVRQRLERYYEGPGREDPITISLPLRSYAPQFSPREVPPPPPARRTSLGLYLTGALPLLFWAFHTLTTSSTPAPLPNRIDILTTRGDLRAPTPDPAPGALSLGPPLSPTDTFQTRLTFSPSHEGQQAGILFWQQPLHYLSLSRRFSTRNTLSLSLHTPSTPLQVLDFPDPEGQSGLPLWLRLHRNGDTITASTSADGQHWQPLGPPLTFPLNASARTGIFAFNGRRDHPSLPARFEFTAQSIAGDSFSPWLYSSDCNPATDLLSSHPTPGPPCATERYLPAPTSPAWSFTTRIDTPDTESLSSGLFLRGARLRLRLVRYPAETSTLALIRDGVNLESIPDFPGRPPVYLRLRLSPGTSNIEAAASLNGIDFRPVGQPVPLATLGPLSQIGILTSRRTTITSLPHPTTRFLFLGRDFFPVTQ